jgi:hypothetical protein
VGVVDGVKRVVGIVLLVLAVSACAPPPVVRALLPKPKAKAAATPAKPAAPTGPVWRLPTFAPLAKPVAVYGDSLTVEATPYLDRDRVDVRAYSSTAPCDFYDVMTHDKAAAPAQVMVAFSGNMVTTCTKSLGERLAAYRVMLDRIAAIWGDTAVTLVGAPDALGGDRFAYLPGVRELERSFAGEHGWGFVDSSGSFEGLPRDPDGFHFCPGPRDASRGCLVDSPAATAYAMVITGALNS